MDPKKESCLLDTSHQHKLGTVVEAKEKVADYKKIRNFKSVYQILISLDDAADNPSLTRHDK